MTDPQIPKVGQEVDVHIRGVVTAVATQKQDRFEVAHSSVVYVMPGVSWEVVPDPEPPIGSIVRTAQGGAAQRQGNWFMVGSDSPWSWGELAQPCTVLYTPEETP